MQHVTFNTQFKEYMKSKCLAAESQEYRYIYC